MKGARASNTSVVFSPVSQTRCQALASKDAEGRQSGKRSSYGNHIEQAVVRGYLSFDWLSMKKLSVILESEQGRYKSLENSWFRAQVPQGVNILSSLSGCKVCLSAERPATAGPEDLDAASS